MSRRRSDDDSSVRALVALVAILVVTGAAGSAQRLFVRWWPLFALAAVLAVSCLVLLLQRRRAHDRAAAAHQRFLDGQIATTDGMPFREFEALVARLLRRDGWQDVRVCGGAGDLGADVIARCPDGRRLVVQCKRYAAHNLVSSPEMQRFLGTVWHEHEADLAWFVTTSGFTTPARNLGKRRGVVLVGRRELAGWMAQTERRPAA